MNKLVLPLSLCAAATLAGCATYDRATPAPGAVVVTPPAAVPAATVVVSPNTSLRAGSGMIESIAAVPGAPSSSSMRRLTLMMSDGTLQRIDTDGASLALGDRLEITREGYVRRTGSGAAVSAVPPAVVVPSASSVAAPQLQPGFGRIESIAAVPMISAATGATVPGTSKRVGVRMENNIVQFLDTDAAGLSLGDRIEITSDGYIRRP